jgi:hypothetical protein
MTAGSSGYAQDVAVTEAHPETQELAALLAQQQRLAARVDEIGAEERAAVAAVHAASDALVTLERQAAAGAKVSPARRTEAEDRLLQARTAGAAPWGERRKAAQLVAADARQAVAAYVGEHLDPLLAELAERGERAAQEVNAAAEAVVAAYQERQAIESETFAMLGRLGHRVRPGDVARPRSEPVAAEARKLMEQGGEQAPTVLVRPGTPRHGQVTPEAVPA